MRTKEDYHFLRIQKPPCNNCSILFYIPDCTKLEQTADNSHFMWHDIQLSKGPLNKDGKIEVKINGKMEKLTYHTAPCSGIKYFSYEGCNYIASVCEKRPCSHHKYSLSKTSSCSVELVYIYPEDSNDNR